MKHQITFRQYRAMDILMFTVLVCVGEVLITLGATRWFPAEPYTLSLVPAVTAIVMVRWGGFAAIPAFFGALCFCLASGASLPQYVIYCVGNLAALALTQFLYRFGWKRLHDQVLLSLLYGFLTALMMQLGRALIALVLVVRNGLEQGSLPGKAVMPLTLGLPAVISCIGFADIVDHLYAPCGLFCLLILFFPMFLQSRQKPS